MKRIVIFLFLCTSCVNESVPVKIRLNGEAQGTYYNISYYDSLDRDLQDEVDSLFASFDQSASLWDKNSLISRINRNDSTVKPDEFLIQNFELSAEIAANTDGYFDFTIGPLVTMWGFGLEKRDAITPEMVNEKLRLVNYRNVSLVHGKIVKNNPEILLDFNAIAQGFSVDYIAKMLVSKGIDRFIIDVGGEIYASKTKMDGTLWKVGVEHPAKNKNAERSIQQIVCLTNQGLATSGSYRNYYEEDGKRYAHVIDAKSGYPVSHNLLSVTVLAKNAAMADGYSTAFLAMGIEKSCKIIATVPGIEAFFISARDSTHFDTYATDGFKKIMLDTVNQK